MDADTLRCKANEWRAEAVRASESWRPVYERLAAEYQRLADEQGEMPRQHAA
jgi:hypothetical protein